MNWERGLLNMHVQNLFSACVAEAFKFQEQVSGSRTYMVQTPGGQRRVGIQTHVQRELGVAPPMHSL